MNKNNKDKEFLNQTMSLTGKGSAYLKLLDYCEKEYPTIWNDYYYRIYEEDTLSHKAMMKKCGRTTTIKEMTNHILNFVHQKLKEKEDNFIKYKIVTLSKKMKAHLLDIHRIWKSGYESYKEQNYKETNSYLKIYYYVFKHKVIKYWFEKFGIKLNFHFDDILLPYVKLYSKHLPITYTVWEGILKIIFKIDTKKRNNNA